MTQISNIKLYNFRNYAGAEINFSAPITVIYGVNGSGKTNLLEAISLLAPGKGLRGANLEEITNTRQDEWGVVAEVRGYIISTGLERGAKKRFVKIDGEKQRGANTLPEFASVIWLTPQMDGIFLGGSTERRKFFDRIVYNFDPEHSARLAVYENAMRERIKVLSLSKTDEIWLKVLEGRMAEYGIAIAAARAEVTEYLNEVIASAGGSFPKAHIQIKGKSAECDIAPEDMLKNKSALEAEELYKAILQANRALDKNIGRTSYGVHKADFVVRHTKKNQYAKYCSTGEQKAVLISITLGLANLLVRRKNRAPIILLDEIIAHLDESKRCELFEAINELGCQTIMTGAEKAEFGDIKAEFVRIIDGKVETDISKEWKKLHLA